MNGYGKKSNEKNERKGLTMMEVMGTVMPVLVSTT